MKETTIYTTRNVLYSYDFYLDAGQWLSYSSFSSLSYCYLIVKGY